MKKILSFIAVIGLIGAITACSGKSSKQIEADTATAVTENSDSKILVAYFSATGNTKKAAEEVADATGGRLYEIVPEQPYTDADLDYENKNSRTTQEKDNEALRPAIKTSIDIAPYETIYVGFPIWWYKAPNIIYTFLDNHDFAGKKIVVFATAGSSSLESSFNALVKAYPNYTFTEGSVDNASTHKQFADWVKSLRK